MNPLRAVRTRIEDTCAARGLTYPWWIPAYSCAAMFGLAIGACVQRGVAPPTAVTLVAVVAAILPEVVWIGFRRLLPSWIEGAVVLGAVLLFLTHPASPDLAPWLLMVSAGEIAAISPVAVALGVAAVDCVALVLVRWWGHLDNAPIYVGAVLVAADVGVALRWQMRALAAERANSAIVAEQATLSERQRVAREVHDVVGHALSITLLNVTAARHALSEHADVPDAIESLTEAERVGRSAMTDLRRTVAMLGAEQGVTQALPGLDDLQTLVERARAAGLDVHDELAADALAAIAAAGAAAELGVYRIVQESLANIAKHAPDTAVRIEADVTCAGVRLQVRNTLPPGFRPDRPRGSGLPGMAARAEQLGADLDAGPRDGSWVVLFSMPRGDDPGVAADAAPPSAACPRTRAVHQ